MVGQQPRLPLPQARGLLWERRCSCRHALPLVCLLLTAAACPSALAVSSAGGGATQPPAADGIKFQSIPALPGCSTTGDSGAKSRALTPELQHCSWSVQMQRQSSRWYAFEVGPDAADNMSVVIMARAASGQITMALWGPGSDPYRSVPTQVGTNFMETPGLKEVDQEPGTAGGGHVSLASEQQYLFLAHHAGKPLLVGQYVVAIQADMGQPLVSVEVNTPSSMTQLVAEEQEALKELVRACCPGLAPPGSTEALAAEAAAAAGLGALSSWCSTVGHAVTYDLREWYADICHVAPNVCSRDGHLLRLILPPYALRCNAFPQVLSKFSRLRHLDMSYSVAPGSIADVADVTARLPDLRQLHLRGIGLSGPLSCEVLQASSKLEALSLSDNDKLSGSLPRCWLVHNALQELQLAGLSDLHGMLPDVSSSASGGSGAGDGEQLCGFGKLRYINMAGIIGDAGIGFTGTLPAALGFCADLLYLDLSGHSLSGALPALPPSIQFLNLSSNGLSAALPEFAVDAQLQYLDLSFNRFEGHLQDMTLLPYLDWLDLSDNALSGPLPPLPPSVRWVDLSHNGFTGEVKLPPRAGGREPALVLYNVAHNKLTGSVPGALAAQPNLAFLDLSHNDLSGTLHAFAAALATRNTLLQVNLSHNRLTGDVPAQLQHLAAVRPVLVTMKDGYTPVTRIFDVSSNQLSGVFPAWLVTNIPLLLSSCRCSVGVNLDPAAFTCPAALPRLSRAAQDILRRFDYLQCTIPSGSSGGSGSSSSGTMVAGGGQGGQTVPIWQVAAGSAGRHSMTSRGEHKASVTRAWETQQQQQRAQQQGQQHGQQPGQHSGEQLRRGHAALGVTLGVLGTLAAAVAAVVAAVKARSRCWLNQQQHTDAKGYGYSRLPDFSTCQHQPALSDTQSQSPHSSDGLDSPYAHLMSPNGGSSPTASSSSGGGGSSGSRTSRSSCTGDGMVEIALVLRPASADATLEGGGAGSGGVAAAAAAAAGAAAQLQRSKSCGKGDEFEV